MIACHRLKKLINHAHVEVNMLVQAGAAAVDESDCANVRSVADEAPVPLEAGLSYVSVNGSGSVLLKQGCLGLYA